MQHYAYEELNEVINVVIASLFQTYIVVSYYSGITKHHVQISINKMGIFLNKVSLCRGGRSAESNQMVKTCWLHQWLPSVNWPS